MKGRIGLVMTAVLVLGTLECPWAVPAWAAAEYAAEAEQEFGSAQETMSDEENFLEEESFQTNEYEADRQEGECSTGDSEKLIKPYEEMIVETELIVDMEGGCTAEDIKSALETMRESTEYSHMTVNVPAGEYECTEPLYIYSNTTLNSEEGAHYYLSPDAKDHLIVASNNWGPLRENGLEDRGGYSHIQNVVIQGGYFDGNNVGGELIRFIHGNNITVRDLEIYNVKDKGHHLTLAGVDGAVVERCSFYGYLGQSAKEAIHLDVVHNSMVVPGTHCYDDAAVRNVTIQDCEFRNLSRGIGSHSAVRGVFMEGIQILDNQFVDIHNWAIKTFHYKNLRIFGNEIYDSAYGIMVHSVLSGRESSFYEPLEEVSLEEIPSKGTGYDFGIEISENHIENVNEGVRIVGHSEQMLGGVELMDNVIQDSSFGVTFKGKVTNSEISGNEISGAKRSAVFLSDSRENEISGNEIDHSDKYGIYLNRRCEKNKVTGNQMGGNKNYGIYISNSIGTQVQKNKVENNRACAIMVSWKSKDTVVSGNQVRGAKASAIFVNNSSDRSRVKYNKIYKPVYYGVRVKNSDSVQACSNYFYESGKHQSIAFSGSKNGVTKWNQLYQLSAAPMAFWSCSKCSVPPMYLMKVNQISNGAVKVTGTLGSRRSRAMIELKGKTYHASVKNKKFQSPKLPKLKRGISLTVVERDIWGNTHRKEITV